LHERCGICLNHLDQLDTSDKLDKLGEPDGLDHNIINIVELDVCKHHFHKQCILKWADTVGNLICPLCRMKSFGKKRRRSRKRH